MLHPSKNLIRLSSFPLPKTTRKYKIVGKPSLEQWAKELKTVNKNAVLEKLGFGSTQGPVVTFLGSYGKEFEIVNPLFHDVVMFLHESGYQVLI